MRVACDGSLPQADLETALAPIRGAFNMQLQLYPADARLRVLILVSKFDHCLVDLIYRQQNGSLNMDIAAIASNHEIGRQWADNAQFPYHALGGKEAKAENEAKLTALIDQQNIDLIVLARYMQVLTADFVDRYGAQIINIHHSFLPSFKGAEPYSQAHARCQIDRGNGAISSPQSLTKGRLSHKASSRCATICLSARLSMSGATRRNVLWRVPCAFLQSARYF